MREVLGGQVLAQRRRGAEGKIIGKYGFKDLVLTLRLCVSARVSFVFIIAVF
jgi:hypothetical protein